ncbi:IS110 family transposase [Virgibacillus sp. 179-BFC.A HS]|uniref:IS110 family transposase n=1 Tax=Tigheibacillus jepli TaxID=3035914 RepID=A0ABU5CHW9_9BACI|nr:IS110 family transposase [Virgibacillus sp. 179-BFC.A HS]MDY0405015.1 IS110 family transposase [Virgibacillus sp. 179-BFC.A HS]MDY0405045.1 IS110 family transposase [Virgibacillus sp. 179-BFC.A HS]MDY0405936.1 IS110 family transposase [Virgibacillus sp. 179-BFC.A HS]
MDFTQNERLAQITEETIIIGIDIAKHKHVARAIDDRGRDLAKRLVFSNDFTGFKQLLDWSQHLLDENNRNKLILGMEPTGHYWLNLAYYLKALGLHTVVVNPMKVKRTKELDDDSPTKNDTKDAKVIAQVIRAGRYYEPILPEGIYADLREGIKLHDMMQEDLSSIKAQVHNALDRYFPEFLTVFKDWTGKAALHFLKMGYLPEDIRSSSEEELMAEVKQAAKRGVGIKRIQELKRAAETSVGLTVGLTMARKELRYLIDQYQAIQKRIQDLEALLKELVIQVPGARQMMEIKGVSSLTIAGFFAETGDLSNYRDPRQIIKLAGLNLRMNQSGLFKGKTTITKRGRRRLRSLLYQVARPLSIHNEGFKQLHNYYKNRPNNPLPGKQSFVALSRKLIRILFVIGTRNCAFDETRMMRDIPQLNTLQEAA